MKDVVADLELVFVVNKKLDHKWVKDRDNLAKLNFKGEAEESALLPEGGRLYVGIESMSHDDLRIACAETIRALISKNFKTIKLGMYFAKSEFEGVGAIVEGCILGEYNFSKYKSKHAKTVLHKIFICCDDYSGRKINFKNAQLALKQSEIIAKNVNFVRDIVNQTPKDITPLTMSKIAKDLSKQTRLSLKIFGEKYIKEKGMGAMHAVSLASPYPPQLIHLIHKPKNAQRKIVLVGKGLTYDTGGLSLKPSDAMLTMKMDKAGGCVIFGVMKTIAELNLPIEVHGIVGAVENAIGKHAYKPDDVLRAKNSKTIEIKNTDAEGRLVLADCLCYGQELKPDIIIDIATLTGACIVALGEYTIGVMGHSQELKSMIHKSAERSGELTGDLPFNRYLPKLIKSKIADVANVSSGKWGGAITAGLFLSEFISDEYKDKWAHLDIAGPSFADNAWGENPIGASGSGLRLLVDYLCTLSKK